MGTALLVIGGLILATGLLGILVYDSVTQPWVVMLSMAVAGLGLIIGLIGFGLKKYQEAELKPRHYHEQLLSQQDSIPIRPNRRG